ncbi:MAG: ABC transporter ATP-binding protein [Candidatus Methanomethylophilaceae archaeon]|nr:ABC transporter ATP-binding protein [Candidatus Methanomethylophilaceae archaeon]
MTAMELKGLTKDYSGFRANDGISFSVRKGEIFGYLGPNGAGKTTTIRQLLGLLTPTAGTAVLLGADIRDERQMVEARKRIGYLPDNMGFDDEMTGASILDYYGMMRGDGRREELLELFNPPLEKKVGDYSRGNRQMLGIIQAFMHDPELIIMDEPTVGLDPIKQEHLYELLQEERQRGKTVFFSSHVLNEVQRICDRAAILRQGKLVAVEDISLLLKKGGKAVWAKLQQPSELDRFITPEMKVTKKDEDSVHFTFTGANDDLMAHLSSFRLADINIGDPMLEDVFKHYYDDSGEGGQ